MLKKLLSFLLVAIVCLTPIDVSAAPAELSLSKPTYDKQWTGQSCEFTVPWSGKYRLTIAGAVGGTYGSSGGSGIVMTQDVWLNAGQVVKAVPGTTPATQYSTSNKVLTVYGGGSSSLYIDGTLYAKAAGGSAKTKSTVSSGINNVQIYNGDNTALSALSSVHWHDGGSGGTIYATSSPGTCYKSAGHTHNQAGASCTCNGTYYHKDNHCYSDGCDWHDPLPSSKCCVRRFECYKGHIKREEKAHDDSWGASWEGQGCTETLSCNNATNTWTFNCSYSNGQIIPTPSVTAQASVNSHGMSSSAANAGNGYFKIQLVEQGTVKLNGTKVNSLSYNSTKWNVILNDKVVVYCKHGNL